MRYVWTDAGDDPSWGVGDAYGINGYFFPMFDSVTTPQLVGEAKTRGHATGLYIGHNWLPGLTPREYAVKASEEYRRIGVDGLRVQFNIEGAQPDYVAAVLEEWRRLRPQVGTSWSFEGMQGGWMTPGFVARVVACKVRFVPEAFWGADGRMDGVYDTLAIAVDLTKRGVPLGSISPFYDGAHLGGANDPRDWSGYVFTMGRLPQ